MNKEQITDWIRSYLSGIINIPEKNIQTNISFSRYGLDSLTTLGMLGDLSQEIGIELEADLAYVYPTINDFALKVSLLLLEADKQVQ